MDSTTEQVYKAVLALPDDERLELVEALLASEDSSAGPPFDLATMQEIRRRSAEIEASTIQASPWAIVRERVRERLQGKSSG
jgi:putative addiction module component (TIGR02574 family)